MRIEAWIVVGMAFVAGCNWHRLDPALAYYQAFDDSELQADVGAWSGKTGDGEIVPGKFGNALHVLAGRPGASFDVPAGVIGKRGCIEFWAKLDNGSRMITDIYNPALFALHADGAGRLSVGFAVNEGHGMSGLSFCYWGVAYSASHQGCSPHAYSEVLKGDPADWHHYALVWNYDEMDALYQGEPLVVYIDGVKRYTAGKPVAKGKGPVKLQNWMNAKQTLEFSYSHPSCSGYLIDEVKVWTTDRRTFGL